jgi:transposase
MELKETTKRVSKYDLEFKNGVLEFYAKHPEMTKVQICKDFGISEPTLYTWVKEAKLARPEEQKVISIEEYRAIERRNRQLEDELKVAKRFATMLGKDWAEKHSKK